MSYETYKRESASPIDQLAWLLCQIIDDDAPMRWTKHRCTAECLLAKNNNLREIVSRYDSDKERQAQQQEWLRGAKVQPDA